MKEQIISWIAFNKRRFFYRKGYCDYLKKEIAHTDCADCSISDWLKTNCVHWKRKR